MSQTSPVEPLPFNMPLFDCSILLKNANNHILVSFSNGNHVRMKVTTVQLCIQVWKELSNQNLSVSPLCALKFSLQTTLATSPFSAPLLLSSVSLSLLYDSLLFLFSSLSATDLSSSSVSLSGL